MQTSEFRIVESFPASEIEAAWRDCLANSDYGSHYTSPEYFLEPYFEGKTIFAVLALRDGVVHGIATGIIRGKIMECGVPGRPQICMRSAADAAMCDLLWRGIRHYARGRANRISACAWDRLTHTGFTEKTLAGEAGNVILRLDRPAKDLFAAFSATQRNQARLAMKNGVTVKPIETDEQFAEYYELYTDWSKMKGFDMQPMEMQRKAIDLRSNRIAFGAYLEGKLIASSTFRFCPGGVLEYAANNSRREDTKVRPNDLLVWTAVQWACEHGFKSMSMGGSHFFLRKFGGEIVPSFIYSRDETLLKIHDLREFAESVARRIYRLVRTQIVGGIVRRAVRKAARLAPAPESR